MKKIEELLKMQWDEKMANYCLKASVYINMGEYYLDLISSKPKIDSSIYYADQKPGTFEMADDPGTSFEVFRSYNMRLNSPQSSIEDLENENKKVIISNQYSNDKTGGLLKGWTTKRWGEVRENDKEATKEEKRLIIEALKAELVKYEKRLITYYKKYSKKINTVSYWADR